MVQAEKQTRNTVQKKIILDTFKNCGGHRTVEDVYLHVKASYTTISKNTVYRNLRQLAEEGAIRKISLTGEPECYDTTPAPHAHFHCKLCGFMTDIFIDYQDNINDAARHNYPTLQIDEHDTVFKGLCEACTNA